MLLQIPETLVVSLQGNLACQGEDSSENFPCMAIAFLIITPTPLEDGTIIFILHLRKQKINETKHISTFSPN